VSDLQCPAWLVVARPPLPAEVRDGLAQGRFACVYVGGPEHVTGLAGVGERVAPGLAGSPADVRAEIAALADLHRGETVLVVADLDEPDPDGAVLLAVDSDGWVVQPWPGK
jgi:hypothetical protein